MIEGRRVVVRGSGWLAVGAWLVAVAGVVPGDAEFRWLSCLGIHPPGV